MLILSIALCCWVSLGFFALALAAANNGPFQKLVTTSEELMPEQVCFAGLDSVPESVLPEPSVPATRLQAEPAKARP